MQTGNKKLKKILEEICSFYNYDLTINEDGSIHCYNSPDYDFKYKDIKEALKDWLATLEESNKAMKEFGEEPIWNEEIQIIEELEENKKLKKALKEICSFYNYDLTINKDGSIHCYNSPDYDFEYKNIKEALKDWLLTLKETDKDMKECGEEPVWNEEIQIIENIEI